MKKAYLPNPNGGGILTNVEYLVVHAMGEFIDTDGIDYHATDWLKDREGTSCHLMVTPSGTAIKTKEYNQVAWHCRAQGFNFKSIGIEILVRGIHNYSTFLQAIKKPYMTDTQYFTLVELVKEIKKEFPNIILKRHSDVDPENKFDPGEGFDWGKFLNDCQ